LRTLRLLLALACAATTTLALSAPALANPFGPFNQVTNQGPPGNLEYTAGFHDVAYNTQTGEYLVAYAGSTSETEVEVFGQRLNAVGQPVGGPILLSTAGTDQENSPATVVYNPDANEWLVTWDNDVDVFVRRVLADGTAVGTEPVEVSTGQDDIETERLVYSPEADEYMLIWKAFEDGRVFAQRLNQTAGEVGFQVEVGGSAELTADDAVGLAYNPGAREYMVVFLAFYPTTADEEEVYGQRLRLDGTEIGADDFRISSMGPDGDGDYDANPPSIAFDTKLGRYFVVWFGKDDVTAPDENEVYGQFLAADGTLLPPNQFPMSEMGAPGNVDVGANRPRVVYNPNAGEYLVAWHGDTAIFPHVDQEFEIYGRRFSEIGIPLGPQEQISSVQPDGNDAFDASRPALAYNSASCDYLVTWFTGNPDQQFKESESEVFSRRFASTACPATADVVAPVVTALRATPKVFAVPVKKPRASAKKQARSTRLRYRLSEPANVTITIRRRTAGRRQAGKCRKPTRRNSDRPRCRRFVRVGALKQAGKAGKNSKRLRGKLRGKRLKPGRYRAVLVATDAAGNRSTPKRTPFRVVKLRKK
jgi:hypothetical protein